MSDTVLLDMLRIFVINFRDSGLSNYGGGTGGRGEEGLIRRDWMYLGEHQVGLWWGTLTSLPVGCSQP